MSSSIVEEVIHILEITKEDLETPNDFDAVNRIVEKVERSVFNIEVVMEILRRVQ